MTEHDTIKDTEFSGRFSLDVWAKLLKFAKAQHKSLIVVVIIAVILAGIEAYMIDLNRLILANITAPGQNYPIWDMIARFLGATVLSCSLVYVFIIAAGNVSTSLAHDIRQRAFEHLQKLSFSFYDRRPAGWLVARLTSDCRTLCDTMAWGTLQLSWGASMIVAASIIMLLRDWKLALITMAVMPVLTWVALIFQKRIITQSRAVRKANSAITASFNEAIIGIKTTKTLVREDENLKEFQKKTDHMNIVSVKNSVLMAALFPVVLGFGSLAAALAMWSGGNRALLDPASSDYISIAELNLFVSTAIFIIFPIWEMTRILAQMQNAQAAAERIFSLMDTEPEIQDSHEVSDAIEQTNDNSELSENSEIAIDGHSHKIGKIEFKNISFAYEKDKKVLKNFNLSVQPGESIALVGPTGGGKTTVVSLLCRFYEPTEGEILIDGVDYRSRSLNWLQSNLGIVLQHPHLFSGSVADNIRYGRLDANDDEVFDAASSVKVTSFLDDLTDGINSDVGQGGNKLSTGQKQLVSFARAVLADPQIFVMDEATSSVDTETEKLIQDGLSTVLEGRISFIIAHRLSTIRSADRIIYIEDGQIAEDGSHDELIGKKGKYWQLYTNQFANEQTEQILSDDE